MEREAFAADPSNSGTHSASLGGAGGKAGKESEYEGILPKWADLSADIVPTKAWHRLKHFIDKAGLRMEYECDYRAENERLRGKYGLPLRAGHLVAGYEREVALFTRWHLRIHGAPPSRWPWQTPEET